MNLLHLKYAVEIENTKSISQAAKNLYMAQPNLSRAVKELEESLGITIFDRTSKGIKTTPNGEEFLGYARKILKQIDDIETMFKTEKKSKHHFAVSVPRTTYISHAFVEFSKKINHDSYELFYKETNSKRAIDNILNAGYNLGIIRYAENSDKYFRELLDEKNFEYEVITRFTYMPVMSEYHKLAGKDNIEFKDLAQYVEIAHADPYVPSLPLSVVRKEELPDNVRKRIFVYERASQFEILSENHDTFMWLAPLPESIMQKFGLTQKKCASNTKVYKDVLIYKKGYTLTDIDKLFISELQNARSKYI